MGLSLLVCLAAGISAEADAGIYGCYRGFGGYRGYGGYGYGHGFYGKREADPTPEADAKPDAGLLYGGYGLGYAYPLATAYYGLGYYGKRSADADADAAAGIYGGYRGLEDTMDTEDMVDTMEA